jgi:acetyl-CoA carboxylase carboxyl transferase subunit beta
VHFRNPGVGAAVVVWDDTGRLLLIKRGEHATKPGLWAIPAGYVDYGEDVRAAAARELHEETGLVANIAEVVWTASNFHDPAKLTVGIWFAGTVTGGTLRAGDDAADAGFYSPEALPPMAFDTDIAYLASLGFTAR